LWFDPGLAMLFITSTLLHLREDINSLVVSTLISLVLYVPFFKGWTWSLQWYMHQSPWYGLDLLVLYPSLSMRWSWSPKAIYSTLNGMDLIFSAIYTTINGMDLIDPVLDAPLSKRWTWSPHNYMHHSLLELLYLLSVRCTTLYRCTWSLKCYIHHSLRDALDLSRSICTILQGMDSIS
jgi:hypothetical protein